MLVQDTIDTAQDVINILIKHEVIKGGDDSVETTSKNWDAAYEIAVKYRQISKEQER